MSKELAERLRDEADWCEKTSTVANLEIHGLLREAAAALESSAPEGYVLVPRDAWRMALLALNEAEAILGGEYGDTYAVLCETMTKLEAMLAAKEDKP